MVKREARQTIETQKLHMISALYANSAFDESEKGIKQRGERIKDIEQHFNKALELIYNPELHEVKDIDWENPFWQAARRAKQQREAMFRGKAETGSVQQVIDQQEQEPARRALPEYDRIERG